MKEKWKKNEKVEGKLIKWEKRKVGMKDKKVKCVSMQKKERITEMRQRWERGRKEEKKKRKLIKGKEEELKKGSGMKKEGNSCSIRGMTVGGGRGTEDNDKRIQEATLKRGNHRRWWVEEKPFKKTLKVQKTLKTMCGKIHYSK